MKKYQNLGLLLIITVAILSSSLPVTAYSEGMQNQNTTTIGSSDDPQPLGPDWYHKPANYAQLVSWYQNLEQTYPGYLEVFKANELYGTGTITGGYDDYYVRITNEALGLHKPEVLFLGSPHGDETVGTIGLFWFTDWLMRMVFTDEPSPLFAKDYLRWIIDNREIYIEVSHNPYGFDHGPQRYDGNGWDLNREADYDGPEPGMIIWGSVQGKTLREFIDNHMCRIGCDFHGGARMLLYPWANTHSNTPGTSPITGATYGHAPPDFFFYDAHALRAGAYMGDYGGDLNKNNIGTIYEIIWYSVKGGIGPWAYAADIVQNPVEDPYVNDEIYGNYPGTGLIWISPEMSNIKNPAESEFGNDTVNKYGAEVRRFVLHQTDLAQPYIRWQPDTTPNHATVYVNSPVILQWQVNGSLVVDHTSVQYGSDPDPITHYNHVTTDHDEYAGDYLGGTGWDNANNGQTAPVTYEENIIMSEPGEYYFVAKAQVDQVYANIHRPDVYGDDPYLRIIKERTDDTYYESIDGTDGLEEVYGQSWWYSPILHVTVKPVNTPPADPDTPSGPVRVRTGQTYTYETKTVDAESDQVYYYWDWGDGTNSGWVGPFNSNTMAPVEKTWSEKGTYNVRVKAKDVWNDESGWSDFLKISVPKDLNQGMMFKWVEQLFPHLSVVLQTIINLIT